MTYPVALVVEDTEMVARYLSSVLEDLGCEVTTARSGASARAFIDSENAFSVAFVDLGLPDESGLDIIELIQQRRPDIPIIVTTGYSTAVRNDVRQGGVDLYCIPKPFTEFDVRVALEKYNVLKKPA